MNKAGYIVLTPLLKAECFGTCARRERQWILCILCASGPLGQVNDGVPSWGQKMLETMLPMRIGAGRLASCLLSDADPRLAEVVQSLMGNRNSKDQKARDALPLWMADHQTMFMDGGWAWPPQIEQYDPSFAEHVS